MAVIDKLAHSAMYGVNFWLTKRSTPADILNTGGDVMNPEKMREEAAQFEFEASELTSIVSDLDAAIEKGSTKGDAVFDVLRSHMLRKAAASRAQATSFRETAEFME